VAAVLVLAAGFVITRPNSPGAKPTTAGSTSVPSGVTTGKPVILYINQGNGVVNQTNFGSMLSFAASQGFNTIFFQIYREGDLLFQPATLTLFVTEAHAQGMKIYFSLYFTNSTQQIPSSIYALGEDGISLDMSALTIPSQTSLFDQLQQGYTGGETAITTTDFTLPLNPDLLVLETYGTAYQNYIHPGIIGSVGVFTTTSQAQYQQEFQYALQNSDGVMVFDYAGLMKSGY
jgi:hypothetical protein